MLACVCSQGKSRYFSKNTAKGTPQAYRTYTFAAYITLWHGLLLNSTITFSVLINEFKITIVIAGARDNSCIDILPLHLIKDINEFKITFYFTGSDYEDYTWTFKKKKTKSS